ncbi:MULTISPECIES: hypothetical protein [unclassified Knoellia]|uniref:hypothetical protein n=1 Tax=Knoellia altitudinis TaxID=3404795 RepID=UPI0036213DC3
MRTSVGRGPTGYAVSALCAVALLSACGSEEPRVRDDRGTASPSATTSTTPSASPTPTPSSSGTSGATMPPSGRARPTVMSGRVTSIEDGCIVFKNEQNGRLWVLIGETKGLTAGTAYVIQGAAMDSMDPNCSEALPYYVRDASVRMADDPVPHPTLSPAGQVMTLTGVVSDGVEAGCRVLQTDAGAFVLVGPVAVPDGRVRVTGRPVDNIMTTCQQGQVFEVQSASPVR